VGILIGPVAGGVQREQLLEIAPYFGALTLVIVLFDGGTELRFSELKAAAGRGAVLAILGFLLSSGVVAVIVMLGAFVGLFPDSFTWMHGAIIGTILGGSSSVVIMPALRKAGLTQSLSNLVNLESALTDVLCVVSTVALINIAVSGSADIGESAVTLAKSFGVGILGGAIVGMLALLVLRQLRKSVYAYPLTLSFLLILYVIIDEMGGSAALAILTAAVFVGNAPALSKVVGLAKTASMGRTVQTVHDQITFIVKSFFFTFIGTMLGPPFGLLFFGVLIGLALLVARVPSVAIGTIGAPMSLPAKGMVAVCMPRGMAAGVLAMLPYQQGIEGTRELPVVVFAAVFTTIMIFAIGFPLVRRRLPALELAGPTGIPEGAKAAESIGPVDMTREGESLLPPGESDEGAAPEGSAEGAEENGGLAQDAAVPAGGAALAGGTAPADATVVDGEGGPITTESPGATSSAEAFPLKKP